MKRITTNLRTHLIVTHQEATVILWLSCLMVAGTIGSSLWPESAVHAHVPARQIITILDSIQQPAKSSPTDSVEQKDPAPAKSPAPSIRLDINRASSTQLESIPGIGPATARRIIESRSKRKFTSVEDLLDVKGIGKKKLDRMRPYIFTP